MESINELELRDLLKQKLPPQELLNQLVSALTSENLDWESRRGFYAYLFSSQRHSTLLAIMAQALRDKQRVPFEFLIAVAASSLRQPRTVVVESLLKGLRKHKAVGDIFASREWDKWDKRFAQARNELLENKLREQREFKANMIEKFEFLKNQRMSEQAGRILRRLVELYPEDVEAQRLKKNFDEEWAREVLANHLAVLNNEKIERTRTAPSGADEEMLRSFMAEGEKLAVDQRGIATDLAIAFWFMEDPVRAAEILAWAPPNASNEWLRAEFLIGARHFVEALEQLNTLEVKYTEDPETTFAVSYLRAQCLHALGQHSSALEIMQSIVRVRPNYRSAHSFILDWTAGVSWD